MLSPISPRPVETPQDGVTIELGGGGPRPAGANGTINLGAPSGAPPKTPPKQEAPPAPVDKIITGSGPKISLRDLISGNKTTSQSGGDDEVDGEEGPEGTIGIVRKFLGDLDVYSQFDFTYFDHDTGEFNFKEDKKNVGGFGAFVRGRIYGASDKKLPVVENAPFKLSHFLTQGTAIRLHDVGFFIDGAGTDGVGIAFTGGASVSVGNRFSDEGTNAGFSARWFENTRPQKAEGLDYMAADSSSDFRFVWENIGLTLLTGRYNTHEIYEGVAGFSKTTIDGQVRFNFADWFAKDRDYDAMADVDYYIHGDRKWNFTVFGQLSSKSGFDNSILGTDGSVELEGHELGADVSYQWREKDYDEGDWKRTWIGNLDVGVTVRKMDYDAKTSGNIVLAQNNVSEVAQTAYLKRRFRIPSGSLTMGVFYDSNMIRPTYNTESGDLELEQARSYGGTFAYNMYNAVKNPETII